MTQRYKSVSFLEDKSKAVATVGGQTIIKDVVIVQGGMDKVGDWMDNTFIEGIVTQGNLSTTGIKSRAGHPNMCKDSLGTYLGDFYNFRAVEQDGKFKAIADLHLAEISKMTQIDGKGISYHDYLVEMAKNHPDKLGNSIVFTATSEPIQVDKETTANKLILDQFIASDIVDSPAATDGLFKSSDDLGMKLTEFLDENPGIFDAIEKNENAIEIFFRKYKSHLSNNTNKIMSLSTKIKSLLTGVTVKNIDVTDASGTIITVITDANEPQVGDKVEIGGQPAPDGEYTLPDGTVWSVMGGLIETITAPAPAEPAPVEPTPAQASEEPVIPAEDVVKSVESLKSEIESLKTMIENITKSNETKISDLETSILDVAKHVKSDFIPNIPTQRVRVSEEGNREVKRTPLK